jgi:hypothetical protein
VLDVKVALAHVLAATREMSQLTALAERMARPAKEVLLVTAALLKGTAVRLMTSVLLVVSPSLEPVLPKLMFPLMASVARTARYAKAANTEIAVPHKDTVAKKTAIVVKAASPSSAHAPLRPTSLPTGFVVRMARSAKEARTVTAVLPRATAARKRVIVTQDARALSAAATMLLATSPRMVNVARMERLARVVRLATVVLLKAGAARRRIIAVQVASPVLAHVMPQLVTSLLMETVVRMARFARAASGVIAAPRMVSVARAMTTAVMDARRPMVSALAFPLMLSAVRGTERLVWALA